MRTCLVTEYFYPENTGGSPTVLSDLMRRLKDTCPDIEIDVVTSNNLYRLESRKLLPFEDWQGVRIHRVKTPRSNRPSSALRLAAGFLFSEIAGRKLRSLGRFDLIVVNTNPPFAPRAAVSYLKKFSVPYVYLVHDLYPDLPIALGMLTEKIRAVKVGRRFQRGWLKDAEKVIVQGRCTQGHLAEVYGIDPGRIQVITHWGDPEQIQPMSKDSRFRQKHGLTGFVALYAGNLGPFQGLDVIVDAAKIVGQKRPEITFAMVGQGVLSEEISGRISTENIGSLKLFPAVDPADYADLLASADVCIVPLASGARGLAVPSKFYTILAAGRPAIGVLDERSEIALTLTESHCGFQVDQSDPTGLADAVIRLADEPELADEMGRNARKVLEEKFTIDTVARQYYDCFKSVVEGRSGAGG